MKTIKEKVDLVVAGGGRSSHIVAVTVEHGAIPV